MTSNRTSLDVIQVARPCPANWDAMQGNASRRFCQHCNKHVHNLSAMTRDEAQDLICSSVGELCARYARDEAGAVVTLDYRRVPRHKGWKFWTGVGLLIALAGGITEAVFLKNPFAPPPPPMVMGDIMVAPVQGKIAPASCTAPPTPGDAQQ
jgi:hypothetical protein